MATRNFVPRTNEEGGIGTALKRWLSVYANNIFAKFLHLPAPITLQIDNGTITVSQSIHIIDTENLAASDDLETINGGQDGTLIMLCAANSGRSISIKHGGGNIDCGNGDILLKHNKFVSFVYVEERTQWLCVSVSRLDNGTLNECTIDGGTW